MVKIVPLELETHFAEGTVNAFLAIGETVTLIDTGNPGKESFQKLKSKLHNYGVTLKDIDQIVLTHIHIDHAGAIPLIQEEIEIPIFVHEQAKGSINAGINEFERVQQFFNYFLESCGADPFEHIIQRRFREEKWRNVSFLNEGDEIHLGGQRFEILHVPGHSQCDILLWNPETGDALAGDHLLKAFSVNAFIEPPNPGENVRPKPLLQYRHSLEKVSGLPLTMIYPGHGEAFSEHLSVIKTRLLEQEKRCDQIVQILRSGEKTIFEICSEMYPRLKGRTVFLGLSQIQGHLDLLEERQLVRYEQKGSIAVCHAI
ncbi:MBL fold metallo-hydrolase [Neobacillus sp. NRS-1170]|uniref:MBL fold metallo-hydrolase n=1 Tax=Neobacillus sp. NRS-1170 TaxID=3233898 RepID=UPI003D27780D